MTWSELRAASRRQSDYVITLFITNELSLGLTWLLVNTRITPNQVTMASVICGLGCALSYALGHFIFGSLLLFLSHILDCTDGNLARAKSAFSPIGKWLDMAGDRIASSAVFIGVSIYFIHVQPSPIWSWMALFDAIALAVYYYIVDIGLLLKVSKPLQKIGTLEFKGVHVKWGLLEPVIYGFVVLAPFHLIKLHLVFVMVISLVGIIYQLSKRIRLSPSRPTFE